jgi:hypothetical protein
VPNKKFVEGFDLLSNKEFVFVSFPNKFVFCGNWLNIEGLISYFTYWEGGFTYEVSTLFIKTYYLLGELCDISYPPILIFIGF